MTNYIRLLLCLVAALALLQASVNVGHTEGEEVAAPEAAAAEETAAAEQDAIELSGTITSIEPETSTILVEYAAEGTEAQSSTSPFKVTEATAITSEDAQLELSELKAGDQVEIIFTLDAEGTRIVQALSVQK